MSGMQGTRWALAGVVAAGLGLSGAAQATLIDRGGGLIYDDVLNITWLGDANYAKTSGYDADGLMTWARAVAWADQLVYGGYADWRLASMSVAGGVPTGRASSVVNCLSATEAACKDNELGYMFYYNMGATLGQSILDGTNTANLALFGGTIQSNVYWSGTEFAPNPSNAWYFRTNVGNQVNDFKVFNRYAWAVRPGG